LIKTKNQIIKLGVQLGFFFLTLQVVVLFLFWKKIPPQVPLFYSRPWGEKQLASIFFLWLLPAFSFLVILINLTVAAFLAQKEKLAAQLLIIFGAVFNFLCLVTLVKIIFLIT